jgi:hypothetical protein
MDPLTRRGFLCSLAAVAASRVAPVSLAAEPELPLRPIRLTAEHEAMLRLAESRRRHVIEGIWEFVVPRRDDGDTILELR